jgi:serine/threonine-protein kinase
MRNVTMSSPPSSSASDSTVLNGRYRLLATLAAGGMATVYKGQDTLLNRLVAIKILRDRYAVDPQFVQSFRAEAQAAANLNHPNIVTIFDVGRDVIAGQERQYIVMELVDGQDLKQALRARTIGGHGFSIDEAADIARQVCEGVGYAHRRGLAHCDLKPQNVLITADGRVKVTDFGIARAFTTLVDGGEHSDVVWGTPQYYSPEQATGAAPTPAGDVYSIGVMLYEMLAGRLPFEARDPTALAQMHLTQQPPPLPALNPNVTPQLEGIVMRALAKDPAQRYRDADQFARILAAYGLQGEQPTMVNMPAVRPSIPAAAPLARKPPQSVASPPPAPVRSPITDTIPGQITRDRGGFDLGVWLLGALALLCVLGLIPLYLLVYQAYAAPPPAAALPSGPVTTINNAATTIPAPGTPQPVSVPALIGQPLTEAGGALAAVGLNSSVVEERPGAGYTQTVVLEQLTPPGTLVPLGTVIELVVAKVGESRQVPADLIGRTLDAGLSQTLAAIGWNVVVTDAMHFSPAGTILAIEPPGGSQLAVSDTLTVTVSTGGRLDLDVSMPPITLESVTLARDTFVPGQTVQFKVNWRADAAVGQDYNVGWYLFTPDNATVLAQGADRAPQNNGLPAPTSAWSAGTRVEDTYALQLPANLSPGTYPLQIGLYSGPARLRVVDPGRTIASNDLVVLAVITVQ